MGLTKKIGMSQENNNRELLDVDLYVEIDRIKTWSMKTRVTHMILKILKKEKSQVA